jgi:hypothetical protein
VLRDGVAHCLEGAVAAAAILGCHGYPPTMLYLDALDIGHALFLYRQGSRWGTVATSRDPMLRGRPASFPSLRQLALSYHPHYYNYYTGDVNDLTMRGYARIDLGRFGVDLTAAEEDLLVIEEHLWGIIYRPLFPKPGQTRYRYAGWTEEIAWL